MTLKHDEKEEKIKFGINLTNSIDGSIRTGVEGLLYRETCSNGAMASNCIARFNKSDMREFAKNKDKIIKNIEASVVEVNSKIGETTRLYEHMMKTEFTKERFDALSIAFPKKYLTEIEGMVGSSLWSPFNLLTQLIWHNSDTSQASQYYALKQVNRVFGL